MKIHKAGHLANRDVKRCLCEGGNGVPSEAVGLIYFALYEGGHPIKTYYYSSEIQQFE